MTVEMIEEEMIEGMTEEMIEERTEIAGIMTVVMIVTDGTTEETTMTGAETDVILETREEIKTETETREENKTGTEMTEDSTGEMTDAIVMREEARIVERPAMTNSQQKETAGLQLERGWQSIENQSNSLISYCC
jgi:hypothetical protein